MQDDLDWLLKQETLLRSKIETLQDRLDALEAKGISRGRTTFNRGRYLYMYYPNPKSKGGRDRVYVGANPGKVAAALAAADRGREFDALRKKQDRVACVLRAMQTASCELREYVIAETKQLGLDD